MRTVLITAYAVNPLKGSEDGMGWNYIFQAARENRIIAVTRRNNREAIEQYMKNDTANAAVYAHIDFLYFDWPQWMLWWKKGPMLSMIYYYFWQLTLALWLKAKRIDIDIAHNLNFHNDWTPSFLWLLNKPFAWGPIGHHPKIDKRFIKPYGTKAIVKDRLLWYMKQMFWRFDPFLKLTKHKASYIWCMHKASANRLNLPSEKYFLHPSIAAPCMSYDRNHNKKFTVLSIGRFVALKGFDVTVKSFAAFYHSLPENERSDVELVLIGKGPYKNYIEALVAKHNISSATVILNWMSQAELKRVYQTASVFLFPSHEGAGMVVAEAMSNGLPVLCWDNDGPGTIVHPSSSLKVPYTGYDVAMQNYSGKLSALYTNKDYRQHEEQLARRRFEESLDWNVKHKQLAYFYLKTEQNAKNHE